MDSRAEVFEKPLNDTTIMKDYGQAYHDANNKDYKTFLEKYNFTVCLVAKNSVLNKNIKNDENNTYNTLYEDDYFIIYRTY